MNHHNGSRGQVPILSSPFSAQKNRGVEKGEVICLRRQGKRVAEFTFPSRDSLAKRGQVLKRERGHCSKDWQDSIDGHSPPQPCSLQDERGRLLLLTHWPKVLTDMALPRSFPYLYYVQLCQVVIHVQKVWKWKSNSEHI